MPVRTVCGKRHKYSARKSTGIDSTWGRHGLQLRAEAFNVFNHPNFTNPGTTLETANFGVITGTEDPRQVQLEARFYL
jgi:hypothetical protein